MTPTGFRFEIRDQVGCVTLSRPDRLNALTFDIYGELLELFAWLQDREDVRSVMITGEGRGFCSGGDVEDIIGELFARDIKGLIAFTRTTGALIRNIRKLRKPVLAAINGVCVGAGAVIALACDLRIASEKSKFGFIFPQVGLCGADMGSAWLLPRVVGLGHASELLFTGDIIRADRALTIGLVSAVVPPDRLVDEAFARARRLAAGPAFAHAMTKQMLDAEATMSLEAAIEAEAQAQVICMQHPDFREAYEAWREERPPRFEGRIEEET